MKEQKDPGMKCSPRGPEPVVKKKRHNPDEALEKKPPGSVPGVFDFLVATQSECSKRHDPSIPQMLHGSKSSLSAPPPGWASYPTASSYPGRTLGKLFGFLKYSLLVHYFHL